MTYEEIVSNLIEAISDTFELVEIQSVIESGLLGVRQMTNEQLKNEWEIHDTDEFDLSDPDSNPNGP